MGTRLRHLSNKDPVQLERDLESLPEDVNIINILYDGKLWYCFFAISGFQMKDPFVGDTFNSGHNKELNKETKNGNR